MWRLSHLLAERGRGTRRRRYNTPKEFRTLEDRFDQMAAEGKKGGYSAVRLGDDIAEVIRPAPIAPVIPWNEAQALAVKDMARLEAALLRAPLRRAAPSWSAPVAAWRMLLAPGQLARQPRGGVGLVHEPPAAPCFREVLAAVLALTRFFAAPPLVWSRSLAVEVGRIIHVMCPVGKCYFSSLLRRGPGVCQPAREHGFLRRRSREAALAVMHATQWRLDLAGFCVLSSFKDLSKAFQCTSQEALDAAAERLYVLS